MVQACDVCQFLEHKPLKNQILTTDNWTVGILPDQAYLGRAIITLVTHKGSLGELNRAEWEEFEAIVPELENAYKQAFGAEPLNIGCYMNNAYQDEPPHPHVHWHIFPRYRKSYELKGLVFEDNRFGHFYDDNASRLVGDDVVREIAQRLMSKLNYSKR